MNWAVELSWSEKEYDPWVVAFSALCPKLFHISMWIT